VGKYLELARKATLQDAGERRRIGPGEAARPRSVQETHAEGATKATKVPVPSATSCDQSDISDQRHLVRVLTLGEALAEINRSGSGPAINAELYRRGELSEEKAVEYVARAISHRRSGSFEGWRAHVPAVREALTHGVGCECEECV
jgi:hypothetical protein